MRLLCFLAHLIQIVLILKEAMEKSNNHFIHLFILSKMSILRVCVFHVCVCAQV